MACTFPSRIVSLSSGLAVVLAMACGCQGPRIDDPFATLDETGISAGLHRQAMVELDQNPHDPEYLRLLHRVIWRPGYTIPTRESALERLEANDYENLQRTIRQQLPRMTNWPWLTRLCEIVGERGWAEQTPALISSWARPSGYVDGESDRPEYRALVKLHGEDAVLDLVFQTFTEARRVDQQNLRARCWELLHRLGHRERLVRMLQQVDPGTDDLMLADLHRAAMELNLVPYNREEILWIRNLCQPKHAAFWEEARDAITLLRDEVRAELELRDLAIVVSAARHDPALLDRTRSELYQRIDAYVRGQRRYERSAVGGQSERLRDHRDRLTWGDLAAMSIAIRALQVPQVAAHLFDYADRDMQDTSTEYGGLIRLDEQGRFEVQEFPPRIRRSAYMFIAPQEMFDESYTALFHFHFHAQRYRNEQFAGPGDGDLSYADNTRANCLVLTFVREDRMNVDYYRHGRIVVDLGEVHRPGVGTSR